MQRMSLEHFESLQSAHFERNDQMKIDDEMLDKLGVYFVYHEVYDRYGITFESFVERWVRGILDI
ncbi:hypothetical protein [Lysinibacillus sp. 54212]|uniref:hypothetical protein n=1 Tax=Lysinibacillus sp. 54212 TaxID=3119829 RepID=UPI002FCA0DA7